DAMILRSAGPVIPPYDENDNACRLLHDNLSLAINDYSIGSLVLLGHSQCGAAMKLANNIYNPGDTPCLKNLSCPLVQSALDKCDHQSNENLAKEIEDQIIIHGIKNLFDYPVILQAIKEQRLTVEGMQFDMKGGRLLKLSPNLDGFRFEVIAGPIDNPQSTSDIQKSAKA
ncbi:MAG: carbonic anhydrase, partial [Alphaproteobacteria bacterium]